MPNNSGKMNFGIGFNVDKTGLNDLKAAFEQIQKLSAKDLTAQGQKTGLAELESLKKQAKQVEEIFNKNYNFKLNTLNVENFNKDLKNSGINLEQFQIACNKAGNVGSAAFRNLSMGISEAKGELKETHTLLKQMGDTLMNTIRWSIASTAVNKLTGSIQKAWSFTKELDESLNNIRIVTGYSTDEMDRFARKANEAAKSLGASTTEYTNAALIYYQQGLSGEQVTQRTNVTTKVANVTGQNAETVSNQLTAIWNGYKVAANEAEMYIDKVSAVAASTAANLAELSEGMGKVASAANSMGVDIDQLNAQLATMISVTRQDASAIGTSLKTIFSRMGDLVIGGEDDYGVKLGDVSSQLKKVGIDVLDTAGNLRDMGTVIEEVGGKWNSWTKAQQQAIAIAIAGKRQYNNLIALFENWDMYQSALTISQQSVGELQRQQAVYLDSLESKFEKLNAASEDLYMNIVDSDAFKGIIDGLTKILELTNQFINSIGGAGTLFTALGAIATSALSNQIGTAIGKTIHNFDVGQKSAENYREEIRRLEIEARALPSGSEEERKKLEELNNYRMKLITSTDLLTKEEKEQFLNAIIGYNNELNKKKEIDEYESAALDELITKTNKLREAREEAYKTYLRQGDIIDEQGKKSTTGTKTVDWTGEQETRDSILNPETVATRLTEVSQHLLTAKSAMNSYDKKLNNSATSLDERTELVEKQGKLFEKLASDYNIVIDKESRLAKAQSAYIKLYEQATDPARSEQQRNKDKEKMQKILITLSSEYNKVIENEIGLNKKAIETAKNAAKDNEKIEQDRIKTEETIAEMREKNEKNIKDSQEIVEKGEKNIDYRKVGAGLTQIVSGTFSAVTAIQSLTSAFSTLGDESLSASEKISRLLPTIISGATSGIGAVKQFGAGIDILSKTIGISKLAITGWGIAIVAAVAAVIGIGKAWSDQIHKEEKAAQRATEAAQKQKEAYDSVKNAYDALKSSIADYKDAQEGINKLTKGTDEWREAIEDANKQVMELVKTYPELAQYLNSPDSDNRMTFTEEGLNAIQESSKRATQLSYASLLTAQANQTSAQNRASAESIARKTTTADFWSVTAGLSKNLIWHLVEAGANDWDFSRAFTNQRASTSDIEKIAEIYQQNIDMFTSQERLTQVLEEEGISTNKQLIKALMSNSDEIINLSRELETANKLNEATNREIMQGYLSANSEVFKTSSNKGQISSILGSQYNKLSQEYYEQYKDDGTLGMTDEAAQKKYAEYMVETGQWKKVLNIANQNGNKGAYTYVDAAGQTQSGIVIDDEIARRAVASYEAQKKLGTEANVRKIETAISNVSSIGGNIGKALITSELINGKESGNLNSLNTKEIKELQNQIQSGRFTISDQDAKAFGYESATKYIDALKKTIDNYLDDDTALLPSAADLKETPAWQNLSKTSKQVFSDLFAQLADQFSGDYSQYLAQLLRSVGESNAEDIVNLISGVEDWSDYNAVQEFKNKLGFLAPQFVDNTTALDGLIEGMKRATGVYGSIDVGKEQSRVKTLNGIINSVKEIGDTISAEDYKNLSPELQSYFSMMADGTYALSREARDFYDVINDIEKKRLDDLAKANLQKIRELEQERREILESPSKRAEYREQAEKELKDAGKKESLPILDFYSIFRGEAYDKDTIDEILSNPDVNLGKTLPLYKEAVTNLLESLEEYGIGINELGDSYWKGEGNVLAYADLTDKNDNAWIGTLKRLKEVVDEQNVRKGDLLLTDKDIEDRTNLLIQKAAEDKQNELNKYREEGLNYVFQRIAQAETRQEVDALVQFYKDNRADYQFNDEQLREIEKSAERRVDNRLNIDVGITGLEKYETQLAKLERDYNNLDKAIESAFGEDKIKLIERQTENLKEQQKVLEAERDDIQKQFDNQFANDDITWLTEKTGIDPNQIFKNGAIDYTELQNQIEWANKNLLAGGYDALNKEQIFQMYHDWGEETLDLWNQFQDKNEQIQDKITEQLDSNLRVFEVRLDNINKKYDLFSDYNDFIRQMTIEETDYLGLTNSYLVDFNNGLDKTREIRDQLLSIENLELEPADKIAKQEELRKNLQENILSQKQLLKQFDELELNQLNKITEEYSKQVEYLSSINSLINYQIKMLELLGKTSNQDLNASYEAQLNIQQRITKTREERYNTAQAQYQDAIARQASDDVIEAYRDTYLQAGEAYASSIVDYSSALKEKYNRAMNQVLEDIFGDQESIKEEQDWIRKTEEEYFDTVERYFALQGLSRDFDSAINATNNVEIQKELNELKKQELGILEKEGKISQYDIDRAKAKLEILQAEIALRDAQQAKTQMQLVRGANGTYSYEYVSDQSAIDEAEQRLLDAQSKLYDLDKSEYKSTLDEMFDYTKEFVDKFRELMEDGFSEGDKALLEPYWEMVTNKLGDFVGAQGNLTDTIALLGQGGTLPGISPELSEKISKLFNEDGSIKNLDQVISMIGPEGLMEIFNAITGQNIALDKVVGEMFGVTEGEISKSQDAIVEQTEEMSKLTEVTAGLREQYQLMADDILSVVDATNKLLLTNQKLIEETGVSEGETIEDTRLEKVTAPILDTVKEDLKNHLAIIKQDLILPLKTTSDSISKLTNTFVEKVLQSINVTNNFPNSIVDKDTAVNAFNEVFNNIELLAGQHANKTNRWSK